MPRPKEFDTHEALEQAVRVFWEKGYEATSLQDLLAAMGLSKSSFYATFGSKHELFLGAVERYTETRLESLAARLKSGASGRESIEQAFKTLVNALVSSGGRRGCFVNNCAVELAPRDPAVETRVRHGVQLMEDAFYHALRHAQAHGEVPATKDPRAVARFLTSSMNGLQVMAKFNPGRSLLEDVVQVVLESLD